MSNVDGVCFEGKKGDLYYIWLIWFTTQLHRLLAGQHSKKQANKNGLGVSTPYMSLENIESVAEEGFKDRASTGDMTFLEQPTSNFKSFGSLILSISSFCTQGHI